MDVSDFEHAIKLGLGRAILHLQNHDAAPYRDVILQACLKNTVRDRQVEGGKSVYMMDIINLTGEKAFYRQHILDAASKIDEQMDSYNREHLLDLVQAFACEGDIEAQQLIYDSFNNSSASVKISRRVIELDGIEGFLLVVEKFSQLVKTNPDYYAYDLLLHELEEQIGEDVATEKLHKARLENANVDTYLKAVEVARNERKSIQDKINHRAKITPSPYSELKQRIEMGQNGNYHGWGKRTDPNSLLQAANDLLDVVERGNSKQIQLYLQIFGLTPFPLDPQLLFKLVDNPSMFRATDTLRVLRNNRHPAVRELALKLINENRYTGHAVGLLQSNFEIGDWQLIESVTRRALADMDYHNLEMSVRDIFRKHPSKDAAQTLLNLYEYGGVCSFCRQYFVEALHSINALPDSIREECLYDSNLDIRALAQRNFEPET